MYKILTVRDTVRVPPSKFGLEINEAVKQSLQEQVEGRLEPEIGVLLVVTDIINVSEGEILPEDGAIHYTVEFKVLTFVPEVNEVVMGEVIDITAFGAFTRIGPMDALVHISQVMDDKVAYNEKLSTLVGKKSGAKLQQGAIVRARVASVSLGKGGRSKIALTMRQPHLGALEWIEREKKAKKKEEAKK
ncbi:MAG: DNA-directed RNA polymerase [Candidatus Aenigmatarchaeota archaeon]